MSRTVCAQPGCPQFAVARGRCTEHQLDGGGNTSWGNRRDRAAQARFRREVGNLFAWQCAAIVDGARCDVREPAQLQAHHTQPGNDDPETGVLLCKEHHRAVDPHAR